MNNNGLSQLAQNEGRSSEIKIYRKGRRCKFCSYLLSVYNSGRYCHAHAAIGIKKDIEMDEEREERNKKNSASREKIKKVGRPKGSKSER